MNILFSISSLQIGGEQRVLSILTKNLVNMGHNVTIYVLSKKVNKQFQFDERIKIIYDESNNSLFKNFRRINNIRKLINNNRYDIVIGFAVIPSIICSFASFGKCRCIVTERNDPSIYSLKIKISRYFAYHLCSGAIFQTKDASNYFPYIKLKEVIPNPIDVSKLPKFYKGIRRKRIVNTSRLVPEKNQKMLIEAFATISSNHNDYKLSFYGDGVEKDNLISLAKKLNISDKVEIFDARSDILNIINEDSIFVLTSNHEGFPNSLAEAMSMGIPCISTNCRIGGPKDMIDHNINGKLIDVDNVEQLIYELDELICNKKIREKISMNAIKLKDRLSDESISKKWEKFIVKCRK